MNLATRQFQDVDFLLPTTDMVLRTKVSKQVFLRARLPSRSIDGSGSVLSKATAYGQVPAAELLKVGEYKKACAIATDKGLPLSPPPMSMSGLARDFFTDMDSSSQHNPFSRSSNVLNRQEVYCADNNMGKSHLWITVSPPDHECPKILFYALPEGEREPVEGQVPDVSLRFKVLADKPGAAAL